MTKVWKVGSRWSENGLKNTSVLSIFRRNNVVFVGSSDETRTRFVKEVKKGDYLAIADGRQIVAIAKVIGSPDLLKNLKKLETTSNDFDFNYEYDKEWVVGVKVHIVEINKKDYESFYYWKMGTFFALNESLSKEVIKYYERQSCLFSIKSYTATLMDGGDNDYRSLLDTHTRYVIPVYQRPYEWGEDQIVPFITDIVNAYLGEERSAKHSEPMFIGTMQLSQKKYISKNEYEQDVIDGQQRITTLSIFLLELKKLYPDCNALKNLQFNWLENHINQQQSNYTKAYFLQGEELSLNKYYKNSYIVREAFDNALQDFDLNIDSFCKFLFHSVYFVVIETAAGLSKTIQIFNTINNTGLDLNGGDLFKVRMYEYLTDFQSADETAFEQINALYQRIDSINKEFGCYVTDIGQVLDIYKNVLITKYDLSIELYSFGWETFYNRLFDTLLGIKDWGTVFRSATKNHLELSLEELDKVISIRYSKYSYRYKNVETEFATRHTDWSRYARSKGLMMYVFLFFHWDEQDVFDRLEELLIAMNKVFFTYSIVYYKQIWEINSFVANAVQGVKSQTIDETINLFRKKISGLDFQNWVKDNLLGYISDNAKRKNLICALSTYLSEKDFCPTEIIEHIFWTPFDIEHIHANADEEVQLDDVLQNSIGNLSQLEQSLNRSIQDKPFSEKRKEYPKSCYFAMKEIAKLNQWNTEEAEARRNKEVLKMTDYLFGSL
ncbi:MAG: DUF262 domain-containing HNH endonuclease family protein [Bacteroidaceae bacterium]|nr:DUF262 domain-containing HNH endonuclease family protein [Bacteroidaceae bacterium]